MLAFEMLASPRVPAHLPTALLSMAHSATTKRSRGTRFALTREALKRPALRRPEAAKTVVAPARGPSLATAGSRGALLRTCPGNWLLYRALRALPNAFANFARGFPTSALRPVADALADITRRLRDCARRKPFFPHGFGAPRSAHGLRLCSPRASRFQSRPIRPGLLSLSRRRSPRPSTGLRFPSGAGGSPARRRSRPRSTRRAAAARDQRGRVVAALPDCSGGLATRSDRSVGDGVAHRGRRPADRAAHQGGPLCNDTAHRRRGVAHRARHAPRVSHRLIGDGGSLVTHAPGRAAHGLRRARDRVADRRRRLPHCVGDCAGCVRSLPVRRFRRPC